jgi:hypothetical protein
VHDVFISQVPIQRVCHERHKLRPNYDIVFYDNDDSKFVHNVTDGVLHGLPKAEVALVADYVESAEPVDARNLVTTLPHEFLVPWMLGTWAVKRYDKFRWLQWSQTVNELSKLGRTIEPDNE